ncbi:uncharacterized protein LOC129797757 [Lutzomyia longipalpis]|uniref:Putative conserved secreted protein n=1 Tax=Lutzomyia longipalpis TaxID=7200 RepID=A0A7G3AHQ5_LUTLO|nr:uncharacterized protein LOC129797757 [Lutzomyia longipalpis]
MEAAWRFRIMLLMAFAVILFGDFLGYGNVKSDRPSPRNPSNLRDEDPDLHIVDGTALNILDSSPEETHTSATYQISKRKLTETLKESCLPKMLCEMAARPSYNLSDRERDLLTLIKSTTLTLAMAVAPTRWHFAAHMGQLLRSGDSLSGTIGCSQLWPNCPFSSQKLMQLSSKVSLK